MRKFANVSSLIRKCKLICDARLCAGRCPADDAVEAKLTVDLAFQNATCTAASWDPVRQTAPWKPKTIIVSSVVSAKPAASAAPTTSLTPKSNSGTSAIANLLAIFAPIVAYVL